MILKAHDLFGFGISRGDLLDAPSTGPLCDVADPLLHRCQGFLRYSALHHAARHAREVAALALFAPSLWLDGWGIPWYSHFFRLVTQKWLANLVPFAERDPWGIKDPRIRALVEQAISSGEGSRAGIAALPGSMMLELRWLVEQVKQEIGHVQQPTLIVHPREDDRASLRNLEFLQVNLRGPTEAVVLDDSYHIVTIDRQHRLVVDRTLEFISRMGLYATPTIGAEDDLESLLNLDRS